MPATESTSDLAAAVSAATSGPNTPDGVKVKRPARQVLWAVFLALAAVITSVATVIGVLAYGPWWKDTEAVALARVNGLKWIGWLLCGDVALLVAAVAIPGGLGQVSASAGGNSVNFGGRE